MSTAAPGGRLAAWRDRDHTRGSLWTSLFVLAVPLIATSLSGAVFQIVDLGFVSRLGEDATTAVVVANQSIRQIVFMFVMGASFGAQALIARAIGAGDVERAEHVTGQVLVLGAVVSLAVAVLGALAAEPLLRGMNVSEAVLGVGVSYVRWILLLSFGFIFGMLFNGILNGAGDSTTPMILTVVQTALSLVAEWVLIFGHGVPALGVDGVALGVAVGQLAAIGLAARVLFRGTSRVHLRLHHLRPDPAMLRRILALAWPPGLQMIGGFLVTIFFLRLMGDFGPKAQAAYSIGLRLGMLGPMLSFPLAGACATLVGQNLGAGDVRRAWRSIGVGFSVHASVLWSVALALAIFRREIIGAFAEDPEVVALGAEMMLFQAGAFFFLGFYFVIFRSLQGAGDVLVPMGVSLATALCVSLPLGLYLATDLGLALGPRGVFIASVVSPALATALTGAWLATGRWARRTLP